MSASAYNPDDEKAQFRVERPKLVRLLPQTPDEMKARLRSCDSCGEAQLFGCVEALYVGWSYFELCSECSAALRKGTA